VKTKFDQYRDNYSDILKKSFVFPGLQPDFFTKIKADHIISTTQRIIGKPCSVNILDVGCGAGLTEVFLAGKYRSISGIDISAELLKSAKQKVKNVDFQHYDGVKIPFPDASFDIAFSICVFHHLNHDQRLIMLCEMRRVVRLGGYVAIYEHNPLNPLTRRTVSNCEFDRDAALVGYKKIQLLLENSGLTPVYKSYIIFFPLPWEFFRRIEQWLTFLPLGAQFTVWARNTPQTERS
jgi:ubiquinone/menaquinone biosynthesis C-methylase UbiE